MCYLNEWARPSAFAHEWSTSRPRLERVRHLKFRVSDGHSLLSKKIINKPKTKPPHIYLEPRSPWAQNGTPCIDVYSRVRPRRKNTQVLKGLIASPSQLETRFKQHLLVRLFANVVQSLESELNGLLGKLRETAGTGAMKALPWVNRYEVLVLLFLAALAFFCFGQQPALSWVISCEILSAYWSPRDFYPWETQVFSLMLGLLRLGRVSYHTPPPVFFEVFFPRSCPPFSL